MRELTFRDAINEAMKEEMRRDETVFVMGEDVAHAGGVRGVTRGLLQEFGEDRCFDTPISEESIVGAGVGAAISGSRPIVEVMYSDFLGTCMDEVYNKAAKWRYMHGSQMKMPLVIRTSFGGGFGGAAEHSQSLEAWFMHIPGLHIVVPSTPYDAKGLMKTAIRDDNAVLFFEHRLLYNVKGPVPEEEYLIPLGEGIVRREGTDVTIFTEGLMVSKSLIAAERVAEEGVDVEVIDLRTLHPLDRDLILASARKTGRVVTVEEGVRTLGLGSEIGALLMEEAIYYLKAPLRRVAAPDVPIPYSPPMEKFVIPNEQKIVDAVRAVLSE